MNLAGVSTALTLLAAAQAFAPASFHHSFAHVQSRAMPVACSTRTALHMVESDFASAMPAKPEMTRSERLERSAMEFADSIRSSLGDGVEELPELVALEKAARDGADAATLAIRIYELMIEQGMMYDKDPDTGILTPTDYDIPANLDVPEVKKEFSYLYTYGMSLITSGMMSVDTVKDIVKDRLIIRTGLSPEEFDTWLGF
jgi:hypothetical protein